MVLAAAGGINHDQLVRLSEEHFGKLKAGYQGEVPDLLPCRLDYYIIKDNRKFFFLELVFRVVKFVFVMMTCLWLILLLLLKVQVGHMLIQFH